MRVVEGHTVEFIKTDVTQGSVIEAVVAKIVAKHGRIDILVNNASIFDGFCSINETSTALRDRVINTNLKRTFLMSRAVLRGMMPRQEGTT
jgi:NAD(P)-dependent dehydrogenase (short-subunit alcohol dehydrogenase family)